MKRSRLDWLARELGEFIQFVLLWAGLGSVTSPIRTLLSTATGERLPWWLGPVAAAVLATAVYWSVQRLSWRLVGRAWIVGVAVSVLSVVGFVLFSVDNATGIGSVAVVLCWWGLSVAVGVALTSPTVWRAFRDRVLQRPRS